MYNMYGAHTCKYLVIWGKYTKKDLNLKWPNWDSFDISKLIFLHRQLEKASHKIKQTKWNAYFDWYLEASKRGNDRVLCRKPTRKCLKLYEDEKKGHQH